MKELGYKVGFAIVTPDVGSTKHVQPVCWPLGDDTGVQVLPMTQPQFDKIYSYLRDCTVEEDHDIKASLTSLNDEADVLLQEEKNFIRQQKTKKSILLHQAATTCKGNCSTSLTLQTRIDDYVNEIKRLNKENLEVAEKHRKELEEVKKVQVEKKTMSKAEIKKAQTKAVKDSKALQDNLDHYESLIDTMKIEISSLKGEIKALTSVNTQNLDALKESARLDTWRPRSRDNLDYHERYSERGREREGEREREHERERGRGRELDYNRSRDQSFERDRSPKKIEYQKQPEMQLARSDRYDDRDRYEDRDNYRRR